MVFWQARSPGCDRDRERRQQDQGISNVSDPAAVEQTPPVTPPPATGSLRQRMATIFSTRPATAPTSPVGSDRSPFPPRISSLSRMFTQQAIRPSISAPIALPNNRQAVAVEEEAVNVKAPGTGVIPTIAGTDAGTQIQDALAQSRPETPDNAASYSNLNHAFPLNSNPVFPLRRQPSAPVLQDTGNDSSMPVGSALTNGFSSSPPQTVAQQPDLQAQSSLNHASLSPSTSLDMRKASPMPQALPQPAYSPVSPPWQQTTNGLTSPTDSTPPAGKTSQVLAKLTSECDRLRREIKAERAAKEDALQQFQAVKARVHSLEDTNSTLAIQVDAHEKALQRKERRMDDFKAQLEESVARRKRAEDREAEMGRKLGETVSQAAKEVSEAHLAQKQAENAYATLENEWSGLQRRIAHLRKEVEELTGKIDANSRIHKQQLTQLEILCEQEKQTNEKSEKQNEGMATLLKSYRETEENTKRLEGEMQQTVHEMRWVMRLHSSRQRASGRTESEDEEDEDRVLFETRNPSPTRRPPPVPPHASNAHHQPAPPTSSHTASSSSSYQTQSSSHHHRKQSSTSHSRPSKKDSPSKLRKHHHQSSNG